MPEEDSSLTKLKVLDLFCGAGGFSFGFEEAGVCIFVIEENVLAFGSMLSVAVSKVFEFWLRAVTLEQSSWKNIAPIRQIRRNLFILINLKKKMC